MALRGHSVVHGVTLAESHADAVRGAALTISAVTASQTVAAAAASAPGLRAGSLFLDFNSASPGAKITAAEHIARGGGRYIEGAVMTAVPPHRLKVPLLLGGPYAEDGLAAAERSRFRRAGSRAQISASPAPSRCAAACS